MITSIILTDKISIGENIIYSLDNNNIFEFLDWVLKKKGTEPIDENNITGFMFNRWLSMSDPDVAKIVNITQNRWSNIDSDKSFLMMAKFYNKVLPKITSRVSYIKKPTKAVEKENDDKTICGNMEISLREKRCYDALLEKVL